MLDDIERLQSLRACETTDQLDREVARQLRALGFDRWMHTNLSPSQRTGTVLGNFPTDWLGYYDRHGYLEIDPLVQHCRLHVTPRAWTSGPVSASSGSRIRYFREAAGFDLRSGVAVPMHAPGGHSTMMNVASGERSADVLERTSLGALLLLAAIVHETAQRAWQTAAPEPVHLTQREIDTLRWAAEGKTSWEIGQLIGIGERTVIFHLNNAAKKLGVIGRRQAVTRAIALQLIAL